MEIIQNSFKHCDLVKVSGRVDSYTAPELETVLNKSTNDDKFKIVIDLSAVDFISSAGMRVLIGAQKECRRYNRGEVVLAAVNKKILSALDLAGFTNLFKIFPDVTTAVGYF